MPDTDPDTASGTECDPGSGSGCGCGAGCGPGCGCGCGPECDPGSGGGSGTGPEGDPGGGSGSGAGCGPGSRSGADTASGAECDPGCGSGSGAPARDIRRATRVPGAERQRSAALDDLTTTGTLASGHTVPADWEGLHASAGAAHPPVPGVQIDGCFPSPTTLNAHHGWHHDAQFVLRLPHRWNGKLLVTAAPGVRRQYATDRLIGDAAVAAGYAYAATDKGNSGPEFHMAGSRPGDALAEWELRLRELTVAARATVRRHYGTEPVRCYVVGVSNGGYATRLQLERHPDLYDGGVDWEGPLWRAEGPNLFTHLPAFVAHYPRYRDTGCADAHARLVAAGLPAGSEFLWEAHHRIYWDFTQRTYRAVFDPAYPGSDADYDYDRRPAAVHEAVARVALTGAIGKPLLSFHGTLDTLLPIGIHSDRYAELVAAAGRGGLHRQYRIEGGTHVEGFCDRFPGRLRPMLPVYRTVLGALEVWVEQGVAPPTGRTVAWGGGVDEGDISTW
ncbi:alpha/beta hydrolase [Streptomyces beihaiensis]|uniref:Tannase/feruloyl esterase family alpha/beta hydrolase n=1 Tax=Streptomyces beihaiensis TaxID=2984495 RepID=A0ABT3TX14_9ACTN|nr:alpha/beta hydrolase [Streptomyces beihaiensis]MCX3061594.1 tannase/feruloyl esterase family alpha/beta hydrolase [Streptomyces beihaiensis]